jgi:hypothetical protein
VARGITVTGIAGVASFNDPALLEVFGLAQTLGGGQTQHLAPASVVGGKKPATT